MSVVIPSSTLFFTSGLRDSAYALYFEKELGLPQETIGYIFIALSISYLLSGPAVGWLVGRGFGAYIIAVAFVIGKFPFPGEKILIAVYERITLVSESI